MRRIFRLAVMIGVLAWAPVANAEVIHWTLQGVTFNDGGAAAGSFDYEPTLDLYSSISITTTAGSSYPGIQYGFVNPISSPTQLVTIKSFGHPGEEVLFLQFGAALTNPGGDVATVALTVYEGFCNSGCTDFTSSPTARFSVGSPTVNGVPEPATLLLFGVGLIAVGYRMRYRKQS